MKAAEYTCDHTYTIEILSLDPLVMYLNGFVHSYEIEYLLKLGYSLTLFSSRDYRLILT